MIKKNKVLSVSITTALAVGVLAGCSSNDGKDNTNTAAGDNTKKSRLHLHGLIQIQRESLLLMLSLKKSLKRLALRSPYSSQQEIRQRS